MLLGTSPTYDCALPRAILSIVQVGLAVVITVTLITQITDGTSGPPSC
jgi:hypothetical protein